MIGSWPWHSGRRESGGGRRKMRVDTMFSLFARRIVADGGGRLKDGVFYEVAGAGIVHFENVSQTCTDIYVHTQTSRPNHEYVRKEEMFSPSRPVDRV